MWECNVWVNTNFNWMWVRTSNDHLLSFRDLYGTQLIDDSPDDLKFVARDGQRNCLFRQRRSSTELNTQLKAFALVSLQLDLILFSKYLSNTTWRTSGTERWFIIFATSHKNDPCRRRRPGKSQNSKVSHTHREWSHQNHFDSFTAFYLLPGLEDWLACRPTMKKIVVEESLARNSFVDAFNFEAFTIPIIHLLLQSVMKSLQPCSLILETLCSTNTDCIIDLYSFIVYNFPGKNYHQAGGWVWRVIKHIDACWKYISDL